jgi:hypothetical protein
MNLNCLFFVLADKPFDLRIEEVPGCNLVFTDAFPGLCSVTLFLLTAASAQSATTSLGIFQDRGNVGTVLHPGSVEYDPARQSYTIGGGGENMWFGQDDFRYL